MFTTETAAEAVEIRYVESLSGPLAEQVAAVTSAAYEVGDLVPGLPVADGARETARDVRDDLAAGRPLWVATVDGDVAGSVRATIRADGDWEVRRLAVAPWVRHGGLGRRLLARLEDAAVTAGAARVVLDAVVERGNPAFYARVGFRTVRHFGAPDKPLSEVHMVRDPREPVERRSGADAFAGAYDRDVTGWVATWWSVPGGTRRVTGTGMPEAGADGLLGVDCLPAATEPERALLERESVRAADRVDDDGSQFFGRPAALVPAFVQPRLVHGGLLAWWRGPAARG
ncbi:GNAT family N-acetyltransferase [Streptomyces sp. MS191]|uniref:GNAT family N-acetyltransferase n=1 Tax=Streptomyces sp. ms191 TaxID=1827978 RepID=UPI001C9CD729|nr:GNAT family N-acetyltransferase [Streptomyces sp. ms191]